mgnify:CR=1 FL=1
MEQPQGEDVNHSLAIPEAQDQNSESSSSQRHGNSRSDDSMSKAEDLSRIENTEATVLEYIRVASTRSKRKSGKLSVGGRRMSSGRKSTDAYVVRQQVCCTKSYNNC